jgi:hypothetical protein
MGAGEVDPEPRPFKVCDRVAVERSAASPSLSSACERAWSPNAKSVPLALVISANCWKVPAAVSGIPLRTAASISSTDGQITCQVRLVRGGARAAASASG